MQDFTILLLRTSLNCLSAVSYNLPVIFSAVASVHHSLTVSLLFLCQSNTKSNEDCFALSGLIQVRGYLHVQSVEFWLGNTCIWVRLSLNALEILKTQHWLSGE